MKLVNIHILAVSTLLISAVSESPAQEWSLRQCIDSARVHNKSLQIQRNEIAAGKLRNQEARGALLPDITANAEYKYYTDLPYQLMPQSVFGGPEGQFREAQFGVPHHINASVKLTMPLYKPQVFGAIKATSIGTEMSRLQYHKTEEQIFLEISGLYYGAWVLQKQLAFLDSNIVNTERLLNNVRLLHEQLVATGTDVSRVHLQVDQLQTQRTLVKGKYEQLLNTLKVSMGMPLDIEFIPTQEIATGEVVEYERKPAPEIQLAATRNQLKKSELKTLKMSRLPSVSLFATYGTNGFGYDGEPEGFLNFYPVSFTGVQLFVPLFNGTVTQKKISRKQIELNNSELQASLVSDQYNMKVRNAHVQRSVTLKSVQTIDNQLQLALTVYKQTVLQQKQGIASLTEVLLADNAVREVQQTYISAVADYLQADLELKRFTGNFLNND